MYTRETHGAETRSVRTRERDKNSRYARLATPWKDKMPSIFRTFEPNYMGQICTKNVIEGLVKKKIKRTLLNKWCSEKGTL